MTTKKTDPYVNLGEFIRRQRELAQLSIRQLADMCGISNPYLSQIERGLRTPSSVILQSLAKGLRLSAEWAQKALELHAKATAWANETPLASLFETQRAWAKRALDASAAVARQLWQIDPSSAKATA